MDSSSTGRILADECEQLLTDAGFVLRRFKFVNEEVMHRDADALKGYARSTWHRYTDQIPAQKRDAFLNEVVQRCIELSPADRTADTLRAYMLEVEANAGARKSLWNSYNFAAHTCRGAASQDPQFPT